MQKKMVIQLICMIALVSCKEQKLSAQTLLQKEQKAEIIRNLSSVLQQNYVFLDTALSMGNRIKSQLKQGAYDSLDRPGLLAAELSKDLWSVYHDGHLRVRYDPRLAESIGKSNEVNEEDRKRIFEHDRQVNFGFQKLEVLAGNIGYLKFNQFTQVSEESKAAVASSFRFLQHVDALIIDLRENGGGEPSMIQYICNYLFPKRTHLNDIYVRRDNSKGEFWTTPDAEITTLMHIPIYVLTSKFTFSGAEEFCYDLQTQKRAVIVGEITGGGAHPVEPRAISNGFVVFVPFARAVNPLTGTNWEGKGVQPDIETSADKALEKALDLIRTKIRTVPAN